MRRHDLAYVKPGAPVRLEGLPAPWTAPLMDWIARGLPLVVARQTEVGEGIRLGLTLPTRLGRPRLAYLVQPKDLLCVRPPLDLGSCLSHLPEADQAPLLDLAARCADLGVRVGVYGSLAWEVLSGEAYRHAQSDLDLICDVSNEAQVAGCLDALQGAAGRLAMGLDGELRFPDGGAVAWRELAAAWTRPDTRVLVKGDRELALRPLEALLASCQGEPSHA
jgi:phosphoribosyl-dephospho-CoA transferase